MRLRRRKKQLTVTIGGDAIPVKPMALEATLNFLFLVAPHAATLERHQLGLATAQAEEDPKKRRGFIRYVVGEMTKQMQNAPGDIVRAVALLLDRDPEWVGRHALAEEIVASLPVFDQVNDFASLFRSLAALGWMMPRAEKGD